MKAILTGGAGFIGSNIAEHMIEKEFELTVVDNFHTGKESNLEKVKDKIKLIDSGAGDFFKKTDEKCDVICHQGVYSSSPMYKENPLLTSEIVDDFIALLEYARKNDVKNIVYASTSSIYNGFEAPHNEEMTPFIKDFYTEGRYTMERIGKLYHELYGLNISGLRYFSVYGPHEKGKGKYANLISQFLWELMEDKKPVVYGDGSQTRDFTYVDDVVRANLLCIEKNTDGIFNVGTGENITITQMIELLNKKLGKSIAPEYVENPIKNYVQYTLADITKSEKELGFKASVSLEQGIDNLIQYYKG